jgi:hypothetical protein
MRVCVLTYIADNGILLMETSALDASNVESAFQIILSSTSVPAKPHQSSPTYLCQISTVLSLESHPNKQSTCRFVTVVPPTCPSYPQPQAILNPPLSTERAMGPMMSACGLAMVEQARQVSSVLSQTHSSTTRSRKGKQPLQ